MSQKNILFVCIHNSARSVMAEAFANQLCASPFAAQSAGIEPGKLNPLVAATMAEIGLDVSGHKPRAVAEIIQSGMQFAYVITVCDETSAERCPIFPGVTTRLHWGFPDPSQFTGSREEKLEQTRAVREQIRAKLKEFCAEHCP